jgi:hypothetical protein
MTRLLAIAELRVKEGIAARLAWLVLVAFVVGVGAALWAQGPDPAARAALADRIVLWTAWGLAFVVAAIVPALGLPADVRTGAAQPLLASPASRLEVVLGGTLGYGALATLLLVAMATASTLGMQLAGLGAAERDPVRPVADAEIADAAADGTFTINAAAPVATFRFRVPEGLTAGETLRVRLAPKSRLETTFERATTVFVSAHRPGGGEADGLRVAFKAGLAFTAHLPVARLLPGEEAELTVRRVSGGRALVFAPGSVQVGGARRLYSLAVVQAALCAAPLLFLLAAVGGLGAARFGAPTAVVFAAFVLLLFAGRGVIEDGARFLVDAAKDPSVIDHHEHEGHDHAAPDSDVSPARVAIAKAALAVFGVLPRLETFDRTDLLVERRATTFADLGRAAGEGLPAALLVTLAGWLLFRRREVVPG